jgi:hypothetical protein
MTLFGDHTIAETEDLIRAKDIGRADLLKARAGLPAPPDATWDADYAAFNSRYENAKTLFKVEAQLVRQSTPMVSDDFRTSESGYQAILKALRKDPNESIAAPGDFNDLWFRVEHAQGGPIPENRASIQPKATDVDLEVFKAIPPPPKDPKKPFEWMLLIMVGGAVLGGATLLYVGPKLLPIFFPMTAGLFSHPRREEHYNGR